MNAKWFIRIFILVVTLTLVGCSGRGQTNATQVRINPGANLYRTSDESSTPVGTVQQAVSVQGSQVGNGWWTVSLAGSDGQVYTWYIYDPQGIFVSVDTSPPAGGAEEQPTQPRITTLLPGDLPIPTIGEAKRSIDSSQFNHLLGFITALTFLGFIAQFLEEKTWQSVRGQFFRMFGFLGVIIALALIELYMLKELPLITCFGRICFPSIKSGWPVLAASFGAFITAFAFWMMIRMAKPVVLAKYNLAPDKTWTFSNLEEIQAFLGGDEAKDWAFRYRKGLPGQSAIPEYVFSGGKYIVNGWQTNSVYYGDLTASWLLAIGLWIAFSVLGTMFGILFQPLTLQESLVNIDLPDLILVMMFVLSLREMTRESREKHAIGIFPALVGTAVILGLGYLVIIGVRDLWNINVPLIWISLLPIIGSGYKRMQDAIADTTLFTGTVALIALQLGAPLL